METARILIVEDEMIVILVFQDISDVKKSVDLHDGKISVVSEVGVGTTFKVTLPLKTGA